MIISKMSNRQCMPSICTQPGVACSVVTTNRGCGDTPYKEKVVIQLPCNFVDRSNNRNGR